MTNKYSTYTMGQLRAMVEAKYKNYLNSDKAVYIASSSKYFGIHYSELSSESLKYFTREELEMILSSKFTANPRLVVELDDIYVIHDGSIETCYHENKKCICTDRYNKKDNLKEVLLGSGVWLWLPTNEITSAFHYRRNKMEHLLREFPQQIASTGEMSLEDAQEAVTAYYKEYRRNYQSYGRKTIKTGKHIIVLTFEREDAPYRCSLHTGAYPKLLIYKMSSKLKEETLSKIEELREILESKEERILLREMNHYIGEYGYMPFFYFSRREYHYGGAEFGYHFNLWFAEKFEEPYRRILDLLGFEIHQVIHEKSWMIYGTK